jgi:hypothetical protein
VAPSIRVKIYDRKKEQLMKIRTKIAIFVIAAVLSLAGYGILADALSADHVMAAARPTTQVSVHITS